MRVLRLQVQEGASPEAKADSLLLGHLDEGDEVLLLCHAWSGDRASAQTIARNFGSPMRTFDMGWRPTPTAASLPAKLLGGLRLATALPRMWWHARRWRPDVIDSSQQKWDCLAATVLAWTLRRPHVVHLHYRVRWIGWFPRWRLRRAAHTVALVEYVAAQAREAGARRVTMIHNSMPPPPPLPESTRDDVRRELGVPAGAPLLGQIARLSPEKGPRDALRVLERIAERHPDAHLLVMGDGPEEEALRRDAAASPVGDRLHLLPRAIEEEQRVLAALDFFVFPSVDDISPLSLMKALVAGVPVAAYASGGVSELVLDGTTGLLAPEGDVDALAEHVSTLLGDGELRERLASAAVARMHAEFDPRGCGHAYSQLLRTGLGRGRPPAAMGAPLDA
jgi:glycosyltransferase involved in cell wall biosynthesis